MDHMEEEYLQKKKLNKDLLYYRSNQTQYLAVNMRLNIFMIKYQPVQFDWIVSIFLVYFWFWNVSNFKNKISEIFSKDSFRI